MARRGALHVRRTRRGAATPLVLTAVAVAVVAGALYLQQERAGTDADLAQACTSYLSARQAADAQAPALDAAPLLAAVAAGRILDPSETAELKARAAALREIYADLNRALVSVARAAGKLDAAPKNTGEQVRSFTGGIEAADRAHRDAAAQLAAAATPGELNAALGSYAVPAGPALVAHRELYSLIAAEPSCQAVVDAAVAP